MSWFVYIVKCADDTLYTGVTTDIERRINEHNHCTRKGAKYTRVRRPVTLVYHEPQDTRSSACKRESSIKKLTRTQKASLISDDSTPA
jgi:putative endonuclease